MNSKSALPWFLAIAAVAAVIALYAAGQKHNDQIAKLTAEVTDLDSLRAENESLRNATVPEDEIARLGAANQDLLRLRNEIWKLRREKGQVQQAQLGQQVSGQIYGGSPARKPASPEQQFEEIGEAPPDGFPQTTGDICISNITTINEAKLQWALANRRREGATVTFEQIIPYLENGAIPTCPEGGTYTINLVDFDPACSVPEHKLVYEAYPNR